MPLETDVAAPAQAASAGADGRPALEYLKLEFLTAWRHLGGLESKRLWLFMAFCVFWGLILVAAALLVGADALSPHGLAHVANALALLSVALACRQIAKSERQATERYRNKINLLRRTLLQLVDDPALHRMQAEGDAYGMQISMHAAKELRIGDIWRPRQHNTALYMKLLYDVGALSGLVYLGWALALAVRA